MLIGRSLMFVHNPRTGGSSVRSLLQKAVPDTYYPINDSTMPREQKLWAMHQGMVFAHQYAERLGFNPLALPTFVCIRNPYAHMLSGYRYLAERPAEDVPDLAPDFSTYIRQLYAQMTKDQKSLMERAPYGMYSRYILVGNDRPPNVTIGRTEQLERDVKKFLKKKVGARAKGKLPRDNATRHGSIAKYYGDEEEAIVYKLYRNVFEKGLYQRYEGLETKGGGSR